MSSIWPAMTGIFSVWWHGGSGVGVTLEVGSVRIKPLNFFGWADLAGLVSVCGPCRVCGPQVDHPCIWRTILALGLTLEVWLHRFAGT